MISAYCESWQSFERALQLLDLDFQNIIFQLFLNVLSQSCLDMMAFLLRRQEGKCLCMGGMHRDASIS